MSVIDPATVVVNYNFEEVHAVSVGLFEALEANDITVSLAAAGAGLVLGRLLAPDRMAPEDEVKFLSDLFGWCGAYFTTGKVN